MPFIDRVPIEELPRFLRAVADPRCHEDPLDKVSTAKLLEWRSPG